MDTFLKEDIKIIKTTEDWIHPKIILFESFCEGFGLFTTDNISKDETLIVFGAKYTDKIGARIAKENGFYVIQLDENLFSYEIPRTSNTWFVNHSCDPNAGMLDFCSIISIRDINQDEEITLDYVMLDDADSESFDCNCKTALCRRKVTPNDWKLLNLQKKYDGYFSPYVTKRIADIL